MTKSLDMMTASEIQKAYDKAFTAALANNHALIAAGFGSVKFADIAALNHPLATEHGVVNKRFSEIVDEMHARKRYHGGTQRIIRKLNY